jgi:hypothetical protein
VLALGEPPLAPKCPRIPQVDTIASAHFGHHPHLPTLRPDGTNRTLTEILNFKAYKSQLPVIEQAIETAGLMLGSDKSRGYCLEMICADFLAGVNLEMGNQNALLPCLTRLVIGLPSQERNQLLQEVQVTL